MMWIPLIRTFAHQWFFPILGFQEIPPGNFYKEKQFYDQK